MTSLINLAFDENGQKAAKIDLKALLNEDYRTVKPRVKQAPPPQSHVPKKEPKKRPQQRQIEKNKKQTTGNRGSGGGTFGRVETGRLPPSKKKEVAKKLPKKATAPQSTAPPAPVTDDKFITLSQDQLNQLIGLVSSTQSNVPPPPAPPEPEAPVEVPAVDTSLVMSDLAPLDALNMLQSNKQITKQQLSRDEQLAQSQAQVPLQMRSSFLPSEAVPRDYLAEQRRAKQMEWRKELEAQRREDELRKKTQKEIEKREHMPDHHLFQSVANMDHVQQGHQQQQQQRPAEIPKLELSREMSNVSPRMMMNEPMIKSPLAPHHRNLNGLKDPEELRRIEEARKRRMEHEELIRAQIEEKKRQEQKNKEMEEEPWWVRQDRRKQEALTARTAAAAQPIMTTQVPMPAAATVVAPPAPVERLNLPEASQQSTYRGDVIYQPTSSQRLVLREIETQTDMVQQQAPPPQPPTVKKTATVAEKTVTSKSRVALAHKTNLELRALEREERRRQRQIDLLEEQQRQERRLSQLRSQRNQKKKSPRSQPNEKTVVLKKQAEAPKALKENNEPTPPPPQQQPKADTQVINQLEQLRIRLQQKHDSFKLK